MAAKKPVAKKPVAKPVAKKPAPKPVAKKPASKPVVKSAPKPVVKKPAPKAIVKPTTQPTAVNKTYQKRTPIQAAKDLQNYVKQKNVDLGKKGKPSVFIQAAQRDMGGLTADGIFGPKTKNRAADLLGAVPKLEPKIAQAALLSPPEPAQAVASQSTSVAKEELDEAEIDEPESEPAPAVRSVGGVATYAPPPTTISAAPAMPTIVLPPQTQSQVSDMPADIKAVVIEALNTFRDQQNADKSDYNNLINQLTEKFAPNLKAIAEQVEIAALQRQATSEHNALVKSDERWTQNSKNQQAIIDKLAELVQSLRVTSGISKKAFEAWGVHV